MAATSCPDCGTATESTSAKRPRRCDDCRLARHNAATRSWRERNREADREAGRRYKAEHREQIRAAGRVVLEIDLVCCLCGDSFRRPGGRGPKPTRCPECMRVVLAERAAEARRRAGERYLDAARRHNARRRAARRVDAELVRRSVVFERDGWICQLCGEPVDRTLAHPDPFSASLDHDVPLSRGGSHTYANTQLAHLRCNLRKNNRLQWSGRLA